MQKSGCRLTPKLVHDMSVQQCERACKAAIDLENQRLEFSVITQFFLFTFLFSVILLLTVLQPEVYELVEAISHEVILHTWVWHHLNFRARSKMQDGDDNSSPKLFFVEVNKTSREITSFRCLEDADAGDPTNGCAFCSPSIQPWIFHPSNGDFVMGSPDQRRLLDYYARYEDNLPLCED